MPSRTARFDGDLDGGFTLIELLVVIVTLPIVMAVLAFAIGTTYKVQNLVSSHLTSTGDVLSMQSVYYDDVQSTLLLTTDPVAVGCGVGTPILSLEWNPTTGSSPTYQSVASYDEVTAGGVTSLVRNLCTSGASSTPTVTTVVVQSLVPSDTAVTLTPSTLQSSASTGWIGAQSVVDVSTTIHQPVGSFVVAASPMVNLSLAAP